jgi:pre-mRNA cleavage complex 2 protein Pcf11
VDVKGKDRANGIRQLGSKAAAAAEIAKREAELRTLYVVVPSSDEAKPISCPICKESLKSEFELFAGELSSQILLFNQWRLISVQD